MPFKAAAYAAQTGKTPLAPFTIDRRDPGPNDVQMEILYCGVCHSDLHSARGEWEFIQFPVVPGHEIVGRVTKVGANVKKFKVGDRSAVGCLVDSCRACESCTRGLEQYCERGMTLTYSSPDPHFLGQMTYGGYSKAITVDERFVLKVPENLDLAAAAPLLCAGITTYSPLRHWGATKGKKVGIVGLGGLGHMGVKLARAFGARVVVLTTSPRKAADAVRLGAHEVIVSTDAVAMAAHAGSFDFILDTVSAEHDINAILGLLKLDSNLTLVGAPPKPLALSSFALIFGNRSVSGSNIGDIAQTQEMLDFCGEHGITAEVEVIPMQEVNEAWARLEKGDVKYRFVIDLASLKTT